MKKLFFLICLGIQSILHLKAGAHNQPDSTQTVYKVPEPVLLETMVGNKWGMFQSIIAKKFQPESKFNFFNLTNYEVSYDKHEQAQYIVQAVAYYEPLKNFNIGIGANLKAFSGFRPLAALAYMYNNRNISVIVQPSIELHNKGVTELFALFEYRGSRDRKAEPYFSIQSASSYQNGSVDHDFTYANIRAGIQHKNFRIGPAINMRAIGNESFYTQWNFGGFIGVLIY